MIDDFHHIALDVQRQLIKQLKSVVAQRKAPIILVAVPHHAADVVRAEPEMQGRLKHIEIPAWSGDELKEIPRLGFEVLNVDCPDDIADLLADVAWGSPHLMQVLCRELAKNNGIRETQDQGAMLQPPQDGWDAFLHDVAVENTDSKTLDKLATGRQSRSRRKQRDLEEGGHADLYRALLAAIASTGPKRSLAYNDLRDALQGVLVKVPESNEVTDILKKLSDIAYEEQRRARPRRRSGARIRLRQGPAHRRSFLRVPAAMGAVGARRVVTSGVRHPHRTAPPVVLNVRSPLGAHPQDEVLGGRACSERAGVPFPRLE